MTRRSVLSLLTLPLLAGAAQAAGRRSRHSPPARPACPPQPGPGPQAAPGGPVGVPVDALDEVNAQRARRGLRPFARDEVLTQGAMRLAAERARLGVAGHLANDFALVPGPCAATGCGAWPVGLVTTDGQTWGTCCTFDNYTFAGAAYVQVGAYRYMHLVVR